jgi:hypothetical protein
MKRTLLFLFIAITGLTGRAQSYIPLIDSSAIWLVRQGNDDTIPSFYYYGFNGEDTVINSITYKKLFRSDDQVFSSTEYFAAMREDVTAQQVYWYSSGQEKLLYDFDASAGDTIMQGVTECVVHHVDSMQIGSAYRTNVHLNTYMGTAEWTLGSWVEGIGNISSGGLLGPTTLMTTCDCNQTLVCYKIGGSWVYHNPNYSTVDCDAPVLDVKILANSKAITTIVYPNPVTGTSQLEWNGSATVNRVDVYSVMGSKVRSYMASDNKISLLSSDYAKGNYFYRLYDNVGHTATGKFIIE